MMNQKLIGLMIVAAMGVTACGSSGGGVKNGYAEKFPIGSGSNTITNNNNNNNNNSTQNTSDDGTTNTTPVNTFTGSQGFSMSLSNGYDINGEAEPSSNYKAPESRDEIRRLQVEGRDILLVPDERVGVKDWIVQPKKAIYVGSGSTGSNGTGVGVNNPNKDDTYHKTTETWKVVGNQLENATFGEVYDQFEKRYQFAQGETTPSDNMPKTRGEVKYSGYSTYNPDFSDPTRLPVQGRSEFIVDFGERAVIGQIQPKTDATAEEQFTPVTLKGVINGNRFTGVHSTDDSSHGAVVQGAFYGKNAEEVAGHYYFTTDGTLVEGGRVTDKTDETKPNGTFGAIKQ